MKNLFLFLVSLIMGVIVFWLMVGRVEWQEIQEALVLFPYWKIIIIITIGLLSLLMITYKWRLILQTQGYTVSKKELWKIIVSSFLVSYLVPVLFFANEVLVVSLMRKKLNVSMEKSIAFIFIEKIIGLIVLTFFIIIGLFSLLFLVERLPGPIIIIIAGAIFLFFLLLTFFYWRPRNKKSILSKFLKIFRLKQSLVDETTIKKEIFKFFNLKNKIIWKIFGVVFLAHILILTQHWFLVYFLTNRAINISEIFSLYTFIQLAHLLPFPAALGLSELSVSFIFEILNLKLGTAIAFTLILRAAMLFVSFIGAICLVNLLLHLLRIKINNNKNDNHKIIDKLNNFDDKNREDKNKEV